jgi:uncharacterized protein YoxC
MKQEEIRSSKLDLKKLSDRFTKWVGSVPSLVVHTVFFISVFVLGFIGFDWEVLLLVLTTAVSLEAIYLAIFIQMSVNKTSESLSNVEQDIDELSDDVEEIAEDVTEIQTNVDEISEDVGEIQEDMTDLQKDIDEISEDVDEMSDELDDIAKGDKKVEKRDLAQKELLKNIHKNMNRVKSDMEKLRASKKSGGAATKKSTPAKIKKASVKKKIIKTIKAIKIAKPVKKTVRKVVKKTVGKKVAKKKK